MLTTSAAAKNFFMVYRSFGKLYRQFYTNFRPIASNAAVFTLENMENLIFPRKGGGIFEKLLDFTEKFYIIVELVICIAGKSLLT